MFNFFRQDRQEQRPSSTTTEEVARVMSIQGYLHESARLINAVAPPPITMSEVARHSLQHGRGGFEVGSTTGCVVGGSISIGLFCNSLATTGGCPSITSSLCWILSCLPCGSAVACGLFGCLLCSVPTFICGNPAEEHNDNECGVCHGGFCFNLSNCCDDD